jgi:predicted ATPase
MSEFVKLSEYFDGFANKTSQVYKTEKDRDRYMVLFYRAEDDFNEAKFFDDIEDAQDSAEDWVQV